MAVFKPADPPQRTAKHVDEVCPSNEGLEQELNVEVPIFVPPVRKQTRRVRVHVRNRVRLAPNPILPEELPEETERL